MNRILVVMAVLGLALPSLAAERQRYTISTDGAPRAAALSIATHAAKGEGSPRVRTFRNLSGFAADLTPEEAEALRATTGVEAVEPVVERRATSTLDDVVPMNLASYARQVRPWGLDAIRGSEVWPVTRGGGINVVVLDSGIDYEHPDLKPVYAGGANFIDSTKPPLDDYFHGTHVAGTIAATNNEFGVVGIAPDVKLWSVKVLDQQGKGFDEQIAAGLDWVMSKAQELGGRWVVNMSFGASAEGGKLEREAIAKALERNIVLIAATGNNGSANLDYPAKFTGVIPVGAVDAEGHRASFSAYGGHMALVAPGVGLPSTLPTNFLEESDILLGDQTFASRGTIGSPKGSVTATLVNCSLGRPGEFPANVRGNIALIARGDNAFREKSRNAKEAGALAVVIFDNEPEVGLKPFTLLPRGCPGPDCGAEWNDYKFPLTVNVTYEDGQKLLALTNRQATVAFEFARYGLSSGTSMAAPHASAAAAMVLALDPTLTPSELQKILRNTASDAGVPGWDHETGWGMIDALAAAHYVAPEKFGVQPPPIQTTRRRAARP
ncbi:MAG TPA: S8 family serine peptidase [Thermoanaerobaculia bacterium]|nr:S8 family serine peptidase [Thermoanaerobaculia bacterium]